MKCEQGQFFNLIKSNPVLWTPRYYGRFSLSLGKAHTFFLNSTRLIRTPVNTDNGHFFLAPSTNSHRKLTSVIRTLFRQLSLMSFIFCGGT